MFGLCPKTHRRQAAQALNQAMLDCGCRATFGLIGAKFVPRALAEFGFGGTAWKVITQPEYPGWGHCLKLGAKTLWENWSGKGSQDHVTFGDVAAWQFRYLAGIRPQEDHPGFSQLLLKPLPLGGLTRLDAEYLLPQNRTLKIHWECADNVFRYRVSCDKTTPVTLILPNGSRKYFRGTTKGSCKIP
jgi:alpha-L-rhamnosidase